MRASHKISVGWSESRLCRRTLPVAVFCMLMTHFLLLPATSVSAQSAAGRANAVTVCMARAAEDGSRLVVILPATDVAAMEDRGFVLLPCGDAFASQAARERWRDNICTITATQPESVQNLLEAHLGERPGVLCGMAEIAVGPWRRGEQRSD